MILRQVRQALFLKCAGYIKGKLCDMENTKSMGGCPGTNNIPLTVQRNNVKNIRMKTIAFIRQHISRQPDLPTKSAACLCLVFLLSSASFAMENCAQINGKCRQACGQDETIEQGAFTDCKDKEECCVEDRKPRTFGCCIFSLDAEKFGSSNCAPAVDGQCRKGTGHTSECSALLHCKEQK